MKSILLILIFNLSAMVATSQTSIHELSFIDIDGDTVTLESFKGKKVLFVNVASECGFTGQYKELQELHEQYGEKVVLIGFPCNQFGSQEPGSEDEIKSFCEKNYGVTFLMASKVDVKGDSQHAVYQWLTSKEKNNVEDSKVSWNFEKYLIDENGNLIGHFKSQVKPTSEKITTLL